MLTVNCPSCGAEVTFRSPALPVIVCAQCRSLVTRIDDEPRSVGEAAALPFDVSPVRIGTTGRDGDHAFEVIGRVRWGWDDGSWNEWLLLFDDGSHGWLGEAMGDYMLLTEQPVATAIAAGTKLTPGAVKPGDGRNVAGVLMRVIDIRKVTCLAAEGELPFAAPAGWTIRSMDLRADDGRCASIQRDKDGMTVYTGRYVTLADLAPANLRAIEGWPVPDFAR